MLDFEIRISKFLEKFGKSLGLFFRLGFVSFVLCTMLDIYRRVWSAIRVKKDPFINVQIFPFKIKSNIEKYMIFLMNARLSRIW